MIRYWYTTSYCDICKYMYICMNRIQNYIKKLFPYAKLTDPLLFKNRLSRSEVTKNNLSGKINRKIPPCMCEVSVEDGKLSLAIFFNCLVLFKYVLYHDMYIEISNVPLYVENQNSLHLLTYLNRVHEVKSTKSVEYWSSCSLFTRVNKYDICLPNEAWECQITQTYMCMMERASALDEVLPVVEFINRYLYVCTYRYDDFFSTIISLYVCAIFFCSNHCRHITLNVSIPYKS